MKVKGNGQAKVLNSGELERLFDEGLTLPRDPTGIRVAARALFAICLFTGCRVSEALALHQDDIKGGTITFRKFTTKGKLKTRNVDIHPRLAQFLDADQPPNEVLFPGMLGGGTLTRYMADRLLRAACHRIGIEGVSTHSFRRTALTQMHGGRYPLTSHPRNLRSQRFRHIATIPGSVRRTKTSGDFIYWLLRNMDIKRCS